MTTREQFARFNFRLSSMLHTRATKYRPGVGGVGGFKRRLGRCSVPKAQHLKLELLNILCKLIWLTEYYHIKSHIAN